MDYKELDSFFPRELREKYKIGEYAESDNAKKKPKETKKASKPVTKKK